MTRNDRRIRWTARIVALLYLLSGSTAFAAPLTQTDLYHLNIHYFNLAQDNGCSTDTSGSPGLTITTTVLAAIQTVLSKAKTNGQDVGYALYDQSGNLLAFQNNTSPNYGASITKSMILVAYLNQIGSGAIPNAAKADLQLMIENSDNAAADRMYARLTNGPNAINTVASNAGMAGFKLDTSDAQYVLGQSQITADDFARFFSKIDTLIPAAQKSFATDLLSKVSPKTGLLQAGLPDPVYSKEGWKPEPTGTAGSPWVVNQAAHFVVNNVVYGVAVTVGAAKSQADGEGTIKDLVSAIMTGAATTATSGSTTVTGSISSRVGKGMTPAAQQKFQQFAVAAGQKNGLDPNLIATFYYTETGNTGDSSGNHGDSAKPPPYNGDGNWAEPPAPAGNNTNFFVVGQNSLGYWAPYGLNDLDKNAYGEDGDGDGKIVLNDLADAMFTAASYIIHAAGVKGMNVGDANAYKAGVRYNGSQYALSVRNTYHYLVSGTTINVSGTINNNGSPGCTGASNGANASCVGVAQVTGTPKILAAARCYAGVYYEWAGGHQGYDNFKKGCPDPANPPNNQPHGGPINGDPSGLSGNPSPCGLDCSGLVSIAVDDAYNKKYQWVVGVGTPFSTSVTGMSGSGVADSYWKSIPMAQAQPGDIVTRINEHVEIVVSVSGNTLTTFGAHQTGEKISEVKSGLGDWSGGAWRWTGPGS